MPDTSPEALDRARRTQEVSAVFAAHADEIAMSTENLPAEHVSVAVVTGDHEFTGTHVVARADLVERVPALEGAGGWAMVFSHGTDADGVRARAEEMSTLAAKRESALRRIAERSN